MDKAFVLFKTYISVCFFVTAVLIQSGLSADDLGDIKLRNERRYTHNIETPKKSPYAGLTKEEEIKLRNKRRYTHNDEPAKKSTYAGLTKKEEIKLRNKRRYTHNDEPNKKSPYAGLTKKEEIKLRNKRRYTHNDGSVKKSLRLVHSKLKKLGKISLDFNKWLSLEILRVLRNYDNKVVSSNRNVSAERKSLKTLKAAGDRNYKVVINY